MSLAEPITQTYTVTTSNYNFAAHSIANVESFSLQVVSADASGSDAALNLALSNDGTNFDDIENSSKVVSSNGSKSWSVGKTDMLYVRAEVTASAGTVGLTLKWVFNIAVT